MEKLKRVICALWGHSHILTGCFGYFYCGRCGEQVGDSLAGAFSDEKAVVVGHKCTTCKKNYKRLSWKDKLLAPNPF